MTRSDDLARLSREDRLRLLRFVISFAWADLAVSPGEIAYVYRLVERLGLAPDEAHDVGEWMKTPPRPEEVDPTTIPPEHRLLFLDAVKEMIGVDGRPSPEERESLRLLERLTR